MFDHLNDSLKNDGEFTPEGQRHWTAYKVQQKINRIAKVMIAAGGQHPPDMIGLAEVENRNVLNKLIYYSPLKGFRYRLIHKESPDWRGIDVALLYNPESYNPLKNEYLRVNIDEDPDFNTRDILYSKGIINSRDTVHIFVNHWPSRYGGVLKSKPLRCRAATVLRHKTDSLLRIHPQCNIIIMGDFNDYPDDESLTQCLGAGKNKPLINLASLSLDQGSYKYQGRWGFLDQFIVNRALFERQSGGIILDEPETVIALPFLMEKDEKYTGQKPFRTFTGYKFNGGFSDHLPVIIILK